MDMDGRSCPQSEQDPTTARTMKVRRTRIACSPCRQSRKKCDDGTPCGSCRQRHISCQRPTEPAVRKHKSFLRDGSSAQPPKTMKTDTASQAFLADNLGQDTLDQTLLLVPFLETPAPRSQSFKINESKGTYDAEQVGAIQHCLQAVLPWTRWTLCSITYRKSLQFAIMAEEYSISHVEGYIAGVDMRHLRAVAFKLTPQSIREVIKKIGLAGGIDLGTALNEFVYRADITVLNNLNEGFTGELDTADAQEVREQIVKLCPTLQ